MRETIKQRENKKSCFKLFVFDRNVCNHPYKQTNIEPAKKTLKKQLYKK